MCRGGGGISSLGKIDEMGYDLKYRTLVGTVTDYTATSDISDYYIGLYDNKLFYYNIQTDSYVSYYDLIQKTITNTTVPKQVSYNNSGYGFTVVENRGKNNLYFVYGGGRLIYKYENNELTLISNITSYNSTYKPFYIDDDYIVFYALDSNNKYISNLYKIDIHTSKMVSYYRGHLNLDYRYFYRLDKVVENTYYYPASGGLHFYNNSTTKPVNYFKHKFSDLKYSGGNLSSINGDSSSFAYNTIERGANCIYVLYHNNDNYVEYIEKFNIDTEQMCLLSATLTGKYSSNLSCIRMYYYNNEMYLLNYNSQNTTIYKLEDKANLLTLYLKENNEILCDTNVLNPVTSNLVKTSNGYKCTSTGECKLWFNTSPESLVYSII